MCVTWVGLPLRSGKLLHSYEPKSRTDILIKPVLVILISDLFSVFI